MTTAVTIAAAGHNIIVYLNDAYEPSNGGELVETETIEFVTKNTQRTFHVHQTRDIYITEVRDGETDLNDLIESGAFEAARQYIQAG
ncbi:hypothetical protein HOT99_gp045 [Caulobacter phage CcrBL10]|uniref:Uncharacterized protein n=1 Tax=Caulobacter phage CcrBL10 TaxID=2283269 RepID=A0A385EC27_9CAUD|nr:hypothetical protein HOT99_gp045 [Caulobacter phage CcrBL10]AXQ68249.1 hypothetical protein CcrBL10_gp045 [Caulobacter phage CcrBL10]